ncbi:MAG: putative ATPase [Gammaproteobacteria bacterium]|jgi:predicted AAA+ superfamily ATPase|nr:putative ATPase [Gammaproteobacteria bacterium]
MFKRLLNLPLSGPDSCFLFGPRGTGKTTWIKETLTDHCYIDLLDHALFFDLSTNPEHLPRYFPKNKDEWIVIDEVQKVPSILNEVHRAIESDGRKFILTGSSARSLRKRGVNLLAGRALEHTMHPLTATELGDAFDLSETLLYGQLPKTKTSEDPAHYLQSYVNTYLREEVLQEGLTRNIQTFQRFLEAASYSYGQQINMSNIAKEIGLSNDTVANYFNILEDLLIAKRIPVFNKRAKRTLVNHQKFYFFDVGVYQTIRPRGPLDSQAEINGAALEGLFLQELVAINAYFRKRYDIYFWRTKSKLEVDFVIYGPNGLLAFEIKTADKVRSQDLTGLNAFKQDYPVAQCFLLYMGTNEMQIEDVTVLPIEQALRRLGQLI